MPERDRAEPESEADSEWNPGGVGNAAGADLATPSSTWNPGGTGNANEDDEDAGDDSETSTGAVETEP